MAETVWKQVPGFPLYGATKDGRILNTQSGHFLKPSVDKYGYLRVILCRRGERKNVLVHRAVAWAFLPNPNNLPQINHKNGVKTCNDVRNLEWCTNKANITHAIKLGLQNNKGERNPNHKLTSKDAALIRKMFKEGMNNKSKIGRIFGVSRTLVRYIVEDKIWM